MSAPAPTTPRAVKERVIAGATYRVTLLGAKQGRVMLVKLVKQFGPAAAAFLEGMLNANGGLQESLWLGSADAIRQLTDKMTAEELTAISDELAPFTVVVMSAELQPRLDHIFDEHFAGRYDVYAKWLAFSLEANFASFFGVSSSSTPAQLLEKLKLIVRSLSPSPPASIGTSGASPVAKGSATVS